VDQVSSNNPTTPPTARSLTHSHRTRNGAERHD
jgi:hypothetical protein